jgi:hypothetical protein
MFRGNTMLYGLDKDVYEIEMISSKSISKTSSKGEKTYFYKKLLK